MLRVEALPAGRGDCLLVEFGDRQSPKRILIDGGPKPNYPALQARIKKIPEGQRTLDLVVVTHIDVDHIEGIVELLDDVSELGLDVKEVWFNGFRHLPDQEDLKSPAPAEQDEELTLGPNQGEELTVLLEKLKLPWNKRWHGRPIAVTDDGALPFVELPGGMKLTILSPTRKALGRLRTNWEEVVEESGIKLGADKEGQPDPADEHEVLPEELTLGGGLDVSDAAATKYKPDTSVANGSSIAFLAEYENTSCIFTGDAFPKTLINSLDRLLLASKLEQQSLDLFKPSHHGSRGSLNTDLLDRLSCKTFVISTDGSYFKHPHVEAIARIIRHSDEPTIAFNYETDFTSLWNDQKLKRQHKYSTIYPDDECGLIYDL